MGAWNYGLRIASLGLIVAVFLFVAVGPTARDFRLLLDTVLGFLAHVAWPLAAVVIVFILRKPLADLLRIVAEQRHARAGSSKPSDQEERP
jgi:hypothetical protein